MKPRYVTAPPHVVACDLGTDATVLVNYRTGGAHTLIGPFARWWADLARTGDPATTGGLDDVSSTLAIVRLRDVGCLIRTTDPRPWGDPIRGKPWRLSFGTQELQAGRASLPHVPARVLVRAALAMVVTLIARHGGPKSTSMFRIMRLVMLASGRGDTSADPTQATQAVNAVRRVGLLVPGRVACLEESVATVVLLAASRHRVTWRHGVAADPIRLHAWVETQHGPVAEPDSTALYTAVRTIPDHTKGTDELSA